MDSPTLEQVVSLALQLSLSEQAQLVEQVAAWMARELNKTHFVDPTDTALSEANAALHDSLDSSG